MHYVIGGDSNQASCPHPDVASSAQPRRPLSCITLHFGMGFVYLLQLTVEKLYKKLVYSDGIGHLKVN